MFNFINIAFVFNCHNVFFIFFEQLKEKLNFRLKILDRNYLNFNYAKFRYVFSLKKILNFVSKFLKIKIYLKAIQNIDFNKKNLTNNSK